jgi:hypothetical protein
VRSAAFERNAVLIEPDEAEGKEGRINKLLYRSKTRNFFYESAKLENTYKKEEEYSPIYRNMRE